MILAITAVLSVAVISIGFIAGVVYVAITDKIDHTYRFEAGRIPKRRGKK